MAYLIKDEYDQLLLTEVAAEKFPALERRAALALDQLTLHFYQRHDLAADTSMRRDAFKFACALQVEYLARTGALTLEDQLAAASITSQSIGGTSVSTGGTTGAASQTASTGVCADARAALSGTGLLSRAIPSIEGRWHSYVD